MKHVFIILGYGIPRDILKDENYNFYLKLSFNAIYDTVTSKNISNPIIVFTGGKTDLVRPYKRTEAQEMARLFKTLTNRASVKSVTKNWKIVLEKKSNSSVENYIFSNDLLKKSGVRKAHVHIVCEYTRGKRLKKLAQHVFTNHVISILPMDFDMSPNRYLDPVFLEKKNKITEKVELAASKDKEIQRKYHELHEEKMEYFRKVGHKGHIEAIQKWWKEKMMEFEKEL